MSLHHPARADIEVSDLRIAHLSFRQPDIRARCTQEGVGASLPKMLKRWSLGLAYRVVGDFLSPTPSIKYHQYYYRTLSLHLDSLQAGEYGLDPSRIL